MKFENQGSSFTIPGIGRRGVSPTPAIQRTTGEKIRIAKVFLEQHDFVVLPNLVKKRVVAEMLGCSEGHLENLRQEPDFPRPFDIGSAKRHIESSHTSPRWRAMEIAAWIEGKRVNQPKGTE